MNEESNNLQPQDAATLPNAPDLLRQGRMVRHRPERLLVARRRQVRAARVDAQLVRHPVCATRQHPRADRSERSRQDDDLLADHCGAWRFGNLRCILPEDVKRTVLYIDTEMSKNDTLRVRERIFRLLGWRWGDHHPELRILRLTFNRRRWQQPTQRTKQQKKAKTGLPLQEARIAVLRWKMVLQAIWEIRPTVAVIDGMLDVIRDYNDIEDGGSPSACKYSLSSVWCLAQPTATRWPVRLVPSWSAR